MTTNTHTDVKNIYPGIDAHTNKLASETVDRSSIYEDSQTTVKGIYVNSYSR